MADQSITCPTCGKKIPLDRALRAEIEGAVKQEFETTLHEREREFERRLEEERQRAQAEAASRAEKKLARELADLQQQLGEQSRQLAEARDAELTLRRRERELEQKQRDLELSVERTLAVERTRLIEEAQQQMLESHRLKDAEKERQLADMRRQIEDLKRRAEQGSQQLQGEAGEDALEAVLRPSFPLDEFTPISQGVRGADLHQIVLDPRGARVGSVLWECKNARNWSDAWIPKLKADQRAMHADVAVLVTSSLPKGCTRFTLIEGVVVTDLQCAVPVATLIRAQLVQVLQARSAAIHKEEKLELLYTYLSGVEFRQRVEAMVESFSQMREDLNQERRAAERMWAKREKQIRAVTFNIAGMYGDLQGLVPALPAIRSLELPAAEDSIADPRLLTDVAT